MNCRTEGGFTLIEVMVALLIAGLLLPALLLGFANQSDGVGYLRDKSVAQWVASNQLARSRIEASAGNLLFQGERRGESGMAGRQWFWWVSSSETGIEDFYRIEVRVALTESGYEQPLYTLTGFAAGTAR